VSIDETWDVEQLSSSYIANLLKATRRFVGRGNRADSEQPKQKEYQTTNAKSTNEVFVDCVADNESKDDEAGYNNEEIWPALAFSQRWLRRSRKAMVPTSLSVMPANPTASPMSSMTTP
jgi:hypothetical protein